MQEVLSSKLILVVALGFLVILGAALFIQSPDAPPPNPSNTEDNCICIQILDPVCGDDGNTYGNPCMAECAGVSIAHTGDCSAPPTEIPTPSPVEAEDSSESERPRAPKQPSKPKSAPQSKPSATPPPALTTNNPNGPKIVIISPAPEASVSGVVAIAADVTDKTSVSKVEFYWNGALISADTYIPYAVSYDSLTGKNGPTTITIKAYNASRIMNQAAVGVLVVNPPTFRTMNVAPQNIAEGGTTVVRWEVDFAKSCIASEGWNGTKNTSGSETLKVYKTTQFTLECTGAGGKTSKYAALIVAGTPPLVSIKNPPSGTVVSNIITISAEASDNTGVNKVEFYWNSELIGADTTAPYSINYDTTKLQDSKYTIAVKAYDKGDNAAEDKLSVTTSNGNY